MFTKSRIFILILTFICFAVWLIADLIRTPSAFTPNAETTQALQSLNPELDQNTLKQINQMSKTLPPFNPRAVQNTPPPQPVIIIPSPTPSTSPTISPRPSASTIDQTP